MPNWFVFNLFIFLRLAIIFGIALLTEAEKSRVEEPFKKLSGTKTKLSGMKTAIANNEKCSRVQTSLTDGDQQWSGTPTVLRYGIGGLGTGATPQIADAHGGRGGVEIRNSLPWVAAEPPLMQIPV